VSIKVPALAQNVDTLKMQIKVTLVAININLNSDLAPIRKGGQNM
jgi:hypothetical protein